MLDGNEDETQGAVESFICLLLAPSVLAAMLRRLALRVIVKQRKLPPG